jgi:hypothetical protein
MRHNKTPTVIFTKKYEEPEQRYHCKYHPGCRSIRMSTGLRCQICGSPEIATRKVMTFNNPPSLKQVE